MKILILVTIFEISQFWTNFSKNPHFGQNFRKILEFGQIFEKSQLLSNIRKIQILVKIFEK